jgi:hypothetical protein
MGVRVDQQVGNVGDRVAVDRRDHVALPQIVASRRRYIDNLDALALG